MEGIFSKEKFSEKDLMDLIFVLEQTDENDRSGVIFNFLNKKYGYGTDPKAIEELTKNLIGITPKTLQTKLKEIARPN